MGHPWYHSVSSAKKFGGKPEDYLPLHNWFDDTKQEFASWKHRCLRHHSYGIFELEKTFGVTITNSNGKQIPTRLIGEQHVSEDLGFIPTVQDWLKNLGHEKWMTRGVEKLELE
jgi:hypothetical protein